MSRVRSHSPQHKHGSFVRCLPATLTFLLSSSFLLLLFPLRPVQAKVPVIHAQDVRKVSREEVLTYLGRTLQALDDVLNFFGSQVTRVNLDGVIGIRIVEGNLKVLLTNLELRGQTSVLPEGLVEDLQALRDLARNIGDRSEPNVARNEPDYYNKIWPTISEKTWRLDYPTRNLSAAPVWSYEDKEDVKEGESDHCLSELFGTTSQTKEKCIISNECWTRMTALGYHDYSLTHQIFYLQLGQMSGCMAEMLQKLEQSNGSHQGLLEMQNTFCLNILGEAERLANLSFSVNRRDLFMEQAGLCGMYGYWEFFRYSWLEQILSWQNKETGCYNNENWPHYLKGKTRSQRSESRLNSKCLSHLSTVSLMVLSLYVRYLTEVSLPQQTVDGPTATQLYWS